MAFPDVVTREQWLEARKQLLVLEKQATRERDALNAERRRWRMWWQPRTGAFTFYKDGVEYMTVEPAQMRNWCFSSGVPLFMILNLAVGGKVGPPPDSVQFPVDLLVDYVRVW